MSTFSSLLRVTCVVRLAKNYRAQCVHINFLRLGFEPGVRSKVAHETNLVIKTRLVVLCDWSSGSRNAGCSRAVSTVAQR